MGTIDISIGSLFLGLLLMMIPLYFLWKYRTGMVKTTVVALARMVGQLFLVGLYLKYLFIWDNPFLNAVWVIIMVFVATETALTRTKLKRSIMMCPIMVGFVTGALLVGFYFLGIVLQLNNVFSVQYFIPVLGILMGNMLGVNVIALNTFYSHLRRESAYYYFMLGNGATVQEAVSPFVKQALVRAFQPCYCQYGGYGTCGFARYNDRSDSGRKYSGCCNKIPDDDYCNYNIGFNVVDSSYTVSCATFGF